MAELARPSTMTQEDAFLQAIRDHPDDDTHRLVYADWLQEYGDVHQAARGEFIHLHCEIARLPENSPRAFELADRADALRRKHEAAWLAPLSSLRAWSYDRGLLDRVSLHIRDFIDEADCLFRLGPVREVELRGDHQDVALLGRSEALARVRCLDLAMLSLGATGLEELLRSPHAAGLCGLNLALGDIGPEGCRLLTEASCFKRLQLLDLADNNLSANGIEHLARAAHLAPLVELRLDRNEMGTVSMRKRLANTSRSSMLSAGDRDAAERGKACRRSCGRARLLSLGMEGGGELSCRHTALGCGPLAEQDRSARIRSGCDRRCGRSPLPGRPAVRQQLSQLFRRAPR